MPRREQRALRKHAAELAKRRAWFREKTWNNLLVQGGGEMARLLGVTDLSPCAWSRDGVTRAPAAKAAVLALWSLVRRSPRCSKYSSTEAMPRKVETEWARRFWAERQLLRAAL